jgi:hypothetical protein
VQRTDVQICATHTHMRGAPSGAGAFPPSSPLITRTAAHRSRASRPQTVTSAHRAQLGRRSHRRCEFSSAVLIAAGHTTRSSGYTFSPQPQTFLFRTRRIASPREMCATCTIASVQHSCASTECAHSEMRGWEAPSLRITGVFASCGSRSWNSTIRWCRRRRWRRCLGGAKRVVNRSKFDF